MDLTLLARTVVEAPACPTRTITPIPDRTIICCSEEAIRFGACSGVFVSVPIISVDALDSTETVTT